MKLVKFDDKPFENHSPAIEETGSWGILSRLQEK